MAMAGRKTGVTAHPVLCPKVVMGWAFTPYFTVLYMQIARARKKSSYRYMEIAVCHSHKHPLTDETTRHSVLQVILLGIQGHNSGEDGSATNLAFTVFPYHTGTDLAFLADLQNQSHKTFQVRKSDEKALR